MANQYLRKKRLLLYSIWCYCGYLLCSTGCVDTIQFKPAANAIDAFAVQAKLIKGNPSNVAVRIQTVFDFQEFAALLSLDEVVLLDESDNQLFLESNRVGFYTQEIPIDHPSFKVDYGKQYKIRITTSKGETYESDYDEIHRITTPDSLVARQITIETTNNIGQLAPRQLVGFYLSTPAKLAESASNNRFLWETTYTYKLTDSPQFYNPLACCGIRLERDPKSCYIEQSPIRNYLSFDATKVTTNYIKDFEVYTQVPFHIFAEGFYLTVYQQSLSEAAMEYWQQVSQVVNRTGSVFQEPAGRLVTNFRKIGDEKQVVYGFFYATEQKIIRAYASPELANNPPMYCPPPPAPGCAPVECCNCKFAENSTVTKPSWWVE